MILSCEYHNRICRFRQVPIRANEQFGFLRIDLVGFALAQGGHSENSAVCVVARTVVNINLSGLRAYSRAGVIA
jgi:hypothetical protein